VAGSAGSAPGGTIDLEVTLVLAGLAAALSPFVLPNLRRRGGSGPRLLGSGLVLLLLAALTFGVTRRQAPATPVIPGGHPRVVHEDGYVGSGACQSCHPYRHATWHASYHRTMTQPASPQAIKAPFDGTELDLEGVTWRLERRADEFWVVGRPAGTAAGDGAFLLEKRVVMTTGSHNYQLYWLEAEESGGLQRFPLVYLLYDQMWVPRKSRFLTPPRERTPNETGRWKAHCIKCHATRGRTEDLPSRETRVAELGIACEACHGPGEKHVMANQGPLRRYRHYRSDAPDATIVNPARLPHRRSAQVCGQCHSIEIFLGAEKARNWRHEGTGYRPGEDLAEFQTSVSGRYEDNPPAVRDYLDRHPVFRLRNCFWPDGMLRVAGREYHGLLETPCYQRGDMSCLSCHVMHRSAEDPRALSSWADDQLGAGMAGNAACVQCHPRFESPAERAAHTHHAPDSPGSECYNCHMPYTTWGLLRAIRSHTVDSPSAATSVATGRPNACNQCHLDRTLRWTADTLEGWYGIEPPELTGDEETIAASVLWMLRGDAVQRALMAWSMGWEPARSVSGTQWMVPYLGMLLLDPYDAVRFTAQRTLRGEPGYEVATAGIAGSTKDEQSEIMAKVIEQWNRSLSGQPPDRIGDHLLMHPAGLDVVGMRRLVAQRDDSDLTLFE
jgi:hypothetical protein